LGVLFKDQLDSVLPYTDYTFCNETEAIAYSEGHQWGTSSRADGDNGRESALGDNGNTGTLGVLLGELSEISKEAINDTNGAG
jgi:adenosine kinase